jgi:hypothetical protein
MSPEESERMVLSEYWDERYSEVQPDKQLHEWFKSFRDIEAFLEQHLLQIKSPDTSPEILHLGSGDSVSSQRSLPGASVCLRRIYADLDRLCR